MPQQIRSDVKFEKETFSKIKIKKGNEQVEARKEA